MQATISKPTISEWLNTLDQQYQRYKCAGFEFVFLLRDGIDALPRNDNERATLYHDVSNQVGLAVHTLRNYVSSARKPCARLAQSLGLEIGHLDAVAGLDNEIAEDALQLAAERRYNVQQLRNYVHPFKKDKSIPDIGTPTADDADRLLSGDDDTDDVPFGDNKQYKDYDCTLPDGYDMDGFIALPRNPIDAAYVLREQFSGAELAVLVQELVRP